MAFVGLSEPRLTSSTANSKFDRFCSRQNFEDRINKKDTSISNNFALRFVEVDTVELCSLFYE